MESVWEKYLEAVFSFDLKRDGNSPLGRINISTITYHPASAKVGEFRQKNGRQKYGSESRMCCPGWFLLKLIIGAVCCRLLPFGAGRSAPERIGGLLDSWIVEEDATGIVTWLHGCIVTLCF